MTIYIINGWTPGVGQWELEAFRTEEEAIEQFNYYLDMYEAVFVNHYTAECDDGDGHFWIEEVRV